MHLGNKNNGKIQTHGNKVLFSNNSMGSKNFDRHVLATGHGVQHSSDIYQNKSNTTDLVFIPTGLKGSHHSKRKSGLEK